MAIEIQKLESQFSYQEVQNLLQLAHQSNEEKGLIYATAHQSVDKLREKIGDGTCYVAVDTQTGALVGTISICEKKIAYWYYEGLTYLMKMAGIHPSYKGKGIGSLLVQKCIDQARAEHISVIIGDSAEENHALRALLTKFDFVTVDCVKYKSNSFISSVYARWVDGECPWTSQERDTRYQEHRANIVEKD